MARMKIANKYYNYPEDWQDIILDKYMTFLKIEMPTGLHVITAEHEINTWQEQFLELPLSEQSAGVSYMIAILSHFMSIDEAILQQCKLKQVAGLFWRLFKMLHQVPKVSYVETITHNDQTFYLPSEFMQNSTVGDFLEACQLEAQYSKIQNGKFQHLPKLMCILCRRSKNEPYSDALLARESMFKQFTMENVWRVAFFLQTQNRRLLESLQTYTNLLQNVILKSQQERSS